MIMMILQGAEVGSSVWRLNNRLILHSDVSLAVRDMSAGKHAIFTTHVGLLSVIHTSFVQVNWFVKMLNCLHFIHLFYTCRFLLSSPFISFAFNSFRVQCSFHLSYDFCMFLMSFTVFCDFHFPQTKTCSIYMTSDSYFGPRCLSIVFPKGSPLRHYVNPM